MSNADRVRAALDSCPFDSEPLPIPPKPTPVPTATKPTDNGFPLDVYPAPIADSFRAISHHHNIPIDFLGITGLFTIAAMAGNLYRGDLNGGIKPILYGCIVGPSGVGKTPAYKHLCEYIIGPLRAQTHANYKVELKGWNDRKEVARANKTPFTEDEPVKKVRMITDGTLEAITKYAESCPAGFGVVYDEGGRFFTGANAYKKDTSSVDFWNEFWNGSGYDILRVDSARDRHIVSSATSVLIGMQRDRLLKFFNEDTVASGLLNRFLLCESDYILLNEDVDAFAAGVQVDEAWRHIVEMLYHKGVQFVPGTEIRVPFEDIAKQKYSEISRGMLKEANKAILSSKKDGDSRLMIAYVSKLAAYLPRMALVLAIIDNARQPVISHENVTNAKRLYDYFHGVASKMLFTINEQTTTGLTENEQKLINALPSSFNSVEAEMICEEIGLSKKYFAMQYPRKLSKGWIKRTGRGTYEKD